MAKVTGLGGVFYVVKDPEATRAWYRDVLGVDGEYGPQLSWSEETGDKPYSLISHFKDNEYIKPGNGGFMINLRVDDLDGMVEQIRAKDVDVLDSACCRTLRGGVVLASDRGRGLDPEHEPLYH